MLLVARPSPRPLWLALLFVGAAPGLALAQNGPSVTPPSLGSEGRVGASVALGTGITGLRGREVGIVSADAHLQLTPAIRVGLQGVRLSQGVLATSTDSPDQSRVRLAYAGARGEVDTGWEGFHAGILLAGATARLKSSLLDQEIATRNFLMVEPQVRRTLLRVRGISAEAQAGYRIPLGAPSLPGVATADLRGPMLSVTGRWHRAP